jgi:hypothetical protein
VRTSIADLGTGSFSIQFQLAGAVSGASMLLRARRYLPLDFEKSERKAFSQSVRLLPTEEVRSPRAPPSTKRRQDHFSSIDLVSPFCEFSVSRLIV